LAHWSAFTNTIGLYIKTCPLGGVWGDQQPLIFYVVTPLYMSETNQARKLKFRVLAGIYRY